MKYVENFDKKLEKFAEVIIKIGANVQKGQKVWINCTTDSLQLVYKVTEKAYKAGACDVNFQGLMQKNLEHMLKIEELL